MDTTRRLMCLAAATVLLIACTDNQAPSGPPNRVQHLEFDYRILATDPASLREINRRFENGALDFEQHREWAGGAQVCHYNARFEVEPRERDADTNLDEQTQEPYLSAYGNRHSPGFNFLINAHQSRNGAESCGDDPADTIQGIQLISNPGHASRDWRRGDTATVVTRPQMGSNYLGEAVEYSNSDANGKLVFEHAVDSADENHVQGRFRFLAAAADGNRLIVVTNGTFAMNNRQ